MHTTNDLRWATSEGTTQRTTQEGNADRVKLTKSTPTQQRQQQQQSTNQPSHRQNNISRFAVHSNLKLSPYALHIRATAKGQRWKAQILLEVVVVIIITRRHQPLPLSAAPLGGASGAGATTASTRGVI